MLVCTTPLSMRSLFLTSSGNSPLLLILEGILFLFLLVGMDFSAPVAESSAVECAQLALLGVSCLLCLYAYKWARIPSVMKQLYLILGLFLLFMIIREMSYGRIFYFDEHESLSAEMKLYYKGLPLIQSMKAIAYSLLGVIGLLFCLNVRGVYQGIPLILKQMKRVRFDLLCLGLAILIAVLGDNVFHLSHVEELAEYLLYCCTLNLVIKGTSEMCG